MSDSEQVLWRKGEKNQRELEWKEPETNCQQAVETNKICDNVPFV